MKDNPSFEEEIVLPEHLRLVSCLLYAINSLRDRTLLRFVNVRYLRLPSVNFER